MNNKPNEKVDFRLIPAYLSNRAYWLISVLAFTGILLFLRD